MRHFIAAVSLLLVPSIASADARKDITDIRHGRTGTRHAFLGWNADGDAVARRLVCSEDGERSCRASIDMLDTSGTERSMHLWENSDSLYEASSPDDPKGPISTAEATSFIRAEKRALARAGQLQAGSTVTDPAAVFGTIGGEPTQVYLRTAPAGDELRLFIAVRGPNGASIDLEALDNRPWSIESQEVVDANVSPDGDAVWVAVHYVDGVMCWEGEDLEFTAASRAQVRAKLANAAGMRAYRAGDFEQARSLFETATTEDPAYAWGWFNRGAMHSREGEVGEAATSLRNAIDLDPSHENRACYDEDYAALRASGAGLAMLDCGYEEGC